MYDGFADAFGKAAKRPQLAALFVIGGGSTDMYRSWASLASLAFLSMLAVMFLPRQFHVAVVEQQDPGPRTSRRAGPSGVSPR